MLEERPALAAIRNAPSCLDTVHLLTQTSLRVIYKLLGSACAVQDCCVGSCGSCLPQMQALHLYRYIYKNQNRYKCTVCINIYISYLNTPDPASEPLKKSRSFAKISIILIFKLKASNIKHKIHIWSAAAQVQT